jgi:hypothetical protein|tara:strand:- start:1267 stop:1656 length:390 start_codon:yes stop_codon:yes gene_type:complete
MAYFALIDTSTSVIKEVVNGAKRFRSGTPPTLLPAKGLHWLPFVKVDPSFDSSTQIRTGPVDVVTATEATRTWSVRSNNQGEIDAAEDDHATLVMKQMKALVTAINDGSLVPGANVSNDALKAILKAHL